MKRYYSDNLKIAIDRLTAAEKLPYAAEEIEAIFHCFFTKYREYRERDHPEDITAEQYEDYILLLPYESLRDLRESKPKVFKSSDYPGMIERYFKTQYWSGCNYKIHHFMSGRIRKQKLLESRAQLPKLPAVSPKQPDSVPMPEYIRKMRF